MSEFRGLVSGVFSMLLARWRGMAVLQGALRLISLLLLTPLTAALLGGLLLRSGGMNAIGNTELLRFFLSIPGLLALVLIPAVTVADAYFEQACGLWLLDRPQAGPVSALGAVTIRVVRLAALAMLQLLTAIAVALPFLAVAGLVYWLVLSDADINFYLARRPPKFIAAAALGGLLALAAALLLLRLVFRWFVSLPILLWEGGSPRTALQKSAQRCGGNRRLVLSAVALWLGMRFVVAALTGAGLAWLTDAVFARTGETIPAALRVTTALLLVDAFVLGAAAVLDRALYAATVRYVYLRTAPEGTRPPPAGRAEAPRLSWRWVAAGGLLLVGAAGVHAWVSASKMLPHQVATVTAHRAGAAHGPENSLAALRIAIEDGADAAEIDVQQSAEGTIFVIHDRDLQRIAGLPLVVSQATDAQLAEADIGRLHDPSFAGERLATLEQFIDEARGRIHLSIELKYYGPDPQLAEKVVALLHEKNFVDQATVISLEYSALQQVRQLDPTIRLGYLVSASLGDVTKKDVDFLSVLKSTIKPQFLARARKLELPIAAWTVNSPPEMTRLLLAGVNDLVTDEPRLAAGAAREFNELDDVQLLILRVRQTLAP